jgi:hypothetical protein
VQQQGENLRRAEALRVLGVDILRDLTLRQYMIGAAATPDGAI